LHHIWRRTEEGEKRETRRRKEGEENVVISTRTGKGTRKRTRIR
jgi:hypothetical protein